MYQYSNCSNIYENFFNHNFFVDTTRPQRELEENGQNYWFTSREQMEHDIREHKFLEYGENGGNLYGTNLDSIRDVINQGKMCVLDCSPVVRIH